VIVTVRNCHDQGSLSTTSAQYETGPRRVVLDVALLKMPVTAQPGT